jgi:hypothetical protein
MPVNNGYLHLSIHPLVVLLRGPLQQLLLMHAVLQLQLGGDGW